MSETQTARILIVDDHQLFIDGIKGIISGNPEWQIIGEANDGQAALNILNHTTCELLISDLSMPGMDGVELTRRVKATYPQIRVLVLSMHDDRELVSEVLDAEADGYILKHTKKTELLRAIRQVLDYGTYFSKEIASILSDRYTKSGSANPQSGSTQSLSPREQEILQHICEEYSTKEIAHELNISPRTVETHRKHIMQKTGSGTLVGLIKFAFRTKLVS